MKKYRGFLITLAPVMAVASPSYETARVPPETTAICSQLGEVAYWASIARLSNNSKKRLAQAELYALSPNKLRPAIAPQLVDEARRLGEISHGNAGPGNTSLDGAQADGIGIAMLVYEMCLAGRLGR